MVRVCVLFAFSCVLAYENWKNFIIIIIIYAFCVDIVAMLFVTVSHQTGPLDMQNKKYKIYVHSFFFRSYMDTCVFFSFFSLKNVNAKIFDIRVNIHTHTHTHDRFSKCDTCLSLRYMKHLNIYLPT